MFPAIVLVQAETDLDERPPLRPLGLADKMQMRFLRRAIGLMRVALDAGANDIFPRCRPTTVARDDVIEIQILADAGLAAVLAHILVAFEDVVPGKFYFLL